jgi:RND family efflux transporter MFP subunit
VQRLAATTEQKRSEVAQRESDVAKSASAIEQSESTILQRDSDIVQAEAALEIERGQQAVAQSEYKLLGRELDERRRDLVLRKPQLRSAEATCEAAKAAKRAAVAAKQAAVAAKASAEAMKRSAEAGAQAAEASKAAAGVALRKAQLDLDRTTIAAPFNAVVQAESVDLGSQVSPTTRLATLVGTDEYWVEVSVPVDKLQWLRIPRQRGEEGSAARVYNEAAWGPEAFRTGTVVRMASELEPEGRMARLLVSVPDPLGLADPAGRTPALLIGSYVRVAIEGAELEDVVPLDRSLVHGGDRVWVMGDDGKLEVRRVAVAFRGRDRLLVSDGLAPGERLVTTGLTAPVDGMLLRTQDAEVATPGAEPGTPERSNTETHGQ